MKSRIRAVWRHYSTWALAAVLAVGSLWQYVPEVQEFLPRWVVAVIAVAGLIGKLIPQVSQHSETSTNSPVIITFNGFGRHPHQPDHLQLRQCFDFIEQR